MAKCKRLNIIVEQHRDETSNTQTEDPTQSKQQSQFFDQQPDASTDISNGSQQPKKVRGPTLMSDIWDLDKNERAVIEVDPVTHIPIGGDDGDLARFIGTMVRMSNLAPIDYLSWLHMPEHVKDEMWRIVKSKFKFVPSSNDDTKKWVMKKMNDQWRYWKSDLKSRGFDDSLTEEEMLAKMPDDRVDKDQYKKLVQYWCTEKAKGISSKNKGNCAKYDEPHCLGTRSLQKFIREETKETNGVTPSRAQIYIGSRTRKDENIVNERATQVVEHMKTTMDECGETLEVYTFWKNNIYSKVKGPEKKRRVRCVGSIASSSKTKEPPSQVYEKNQELREKIKGLEGLFTGMLTVLQSRFGDEEITTIANAVNRLFNKEVPEANSGPDNSLNNLLRSSSSSRRDSNPNSSN